MFSLEIYNFVLGCNEKLVSSSEGKGISQVIYQASPLFSICKKIVKKENLIWDIGFLHVKGGPYYFFFNSSIKARIVYILDSSSFLLVRNPIQIWVFPSW